MFLAMETIRNKARDLDDHRAALHARAMRRCSSAGLLTRLVIMGKLLDYAFRRYTLVTHVPGAAMSHTQRHGLPEVRVVVFGSRPDGLARGQHETSTGCRKRLAAALVLVCRAARLAPALAVRLG
jgi:hypothetical protein